MMGDERLDSLISKFRILDADRDKSSEGLIAPSLASYMPFMGTNWPWAGGPNARRPRVIVYGMAQNLAGHPTEWKAYLKTENQGLTRLRDKWESPAKSIGIKPWQTMHAQIAVAFALRAVEQVRGLEAAVGCVTEQSAYTNFVKWSSQRGRWGLRTTKATDLPPRGPDYDRARPYVEQEITQLAPDLIIALGGDAAKQLKKCDISPPIVQVRHSARQVLNGLGGVAAILAGGAQTADLCAHPDRLVDTWMKTLGGLEFRAGDDDGSTVQTPAQVRDALLKDWLYYALAERQIAAAINSTP